MATKEEIVKSVDRDRIYGTRPAHTHQPPSGRPAWKCNSPYCEEMATEHPDDGGFEPVVQGREPWRGR
jgi:hypothetical protein